MQGADPPPARPGAARLARLASLDPALRARKLDRDTRILRAKRKERPGQPFVLFNLGAIALGAIAVERQDWRTALDSLGRSLAHSAPSDSMTRKLFALIARAHQMLGVTGAALRACAAGLALHPEDAELWFRCAVVHLKLERPTRSLSDPRLIGSHRQDMPCSSDSS